MDSSFFLKLLVHGTGVLSLKLCHWLDLDKIFLTISVHPLEGSCGIMKQRQKPGLSNFEQHFFSDFLNIAVIIQYLQKKSLAKYIIECWFINTQKNYVNRISQFPVIVII